MVSKKGECGRSVRFRQAREDGTRKPLHPGRWGPLGPHAGYLVFDKPDCADCRAQPAACACIRAIEPLAVAARVLAWEPLPGKE